MGNTVSLAFKKFQYNIDSYFKDPEAEAHAKQVEKQKKLDEAAAKRKEALTKSKETVEAKNAEAKKEAEDLARRSKVSSPGEMVGKAAARIIDIFIKILIVILALYAGKLEANKAIGYSISMRIVSFVYGALFFFIVIPRSIYDLYTYNKKPPNYTFLPVWNYVPNGKIEWFFFGPFSYKEDAASRAAAADVERLYRDGFTGISTPPIVAKPEPLPVTPVSTPVAAVATPVAAVAPVAKPVTRMER